MIRIGPAGWSYKDWNGVVYPEPRPAGFQEVEYLARYFGAIEINSSFYRPFRPQFAERWIGQVEHHPEFRFTAKLWRRFTHERDATAGDTQPVKAGLQVLWEAGRLGALLLQFPWSFQNTAEQRRYVRELREWFGEYPLVVEFRHDSWAVREVFDWLDEMGIGFCNIDQPVFDKSIAPSAVSTSAVGYVRLHGRNYGQWFAADRSAADRYNYLYSVDELEDWVSRTRAVAERSQDVYVIANNCYLGKALVNCLEMEALLASGRVTAPPELVRRYPVLEAFACDI